MNWTSTKVLFATLLFVPGIAFSQSTGVPDADVDVAHGDPESKRIEQIYALGESPELTKVLKTALEKKGPSYEPRTEHLNSDGSPRYTNRLITEDSPYLIQHAHNPVNWYPWGEEAFARALEENKPIFMSIGYATCHWCHVMERESFESEKIAEFLNEHFITIKVDREQRPDVDATYMLAVQMITGRGGWPMSSWLTPDAKPFYGGTYYPPDAFLDLLQRVAKVWTEQKYDLLLEADKLADQVARQSELQGEAAEIGDNVISSAIAVLLGNHDDLQGGFSAAPKFPQEPTHFLLLEQARLRSDKNILDVSSFSLNQMSSGGIHDQVAGGFHRYAVDNEWLVPHFEKMLYNQAALARLYFEAYSLTGEKAHLRTARRILDYVQREMTAPEGGFYSATDADSEGEEGVFFVWSVEELTEVLGEDDAKLAMLIWEVTEYGNFEGANILHLDGSIDEVAEELSMEPAELVATMDRLSAVLLEVREKREHPLLDDKLITEWNGMMITAFAQVAAGLNDASYQQTAIAAADAMWRLNRRDNGSFWRAHFDGNSSIDASQGDYAFLAEAMLALYDLTFEQKWLDRAVELSDSMDSLFLDPTAGTYFMGLEVVGGASLPVRPKDIFDNSTASGNAVALRVLTQLWHRTGEERYHEQATRLLAAFHSSLTQYPSGFGYLLKAASELLHGETGSVRYAGRGNVRLAAVSEKPGELKVQLSIKPGWHINSREPIQEYLIPTQITTADDQELKGANYPSAVMQKLGFERTELSLYEGDFSISAELPEGSSSTLPGASEIVVQLQACNDKICLAPESVKFNVSVAGHL